MRRLGSAVWRGCAAIVLLCAVVTPCAADSSAATALVGGQATAIWQYHPTFHSPYDGPNSFRHQTEDAISHTYTLYTGVRPLPWLEVYAQPEMIRGGGLSNALGLAGFTNGEVIRNPDVGGDPYLARLFVRLTVPLDDASEPVDSGQNQIGGERPLRRLTFTGGIFATNDLFDTNRYANSPRTQFMNWALITNPAFDFAADTRGYSRGFAFEWATPEMAVRAGMMQMPKVANGLDLDSDFAQSHGEQIEMEVHPQLVTAGPLVLRVLSYANQARMGDYRQAIAQAHMQHTTPDVTATRHIGRTKYGFALNAEQPL